jgi:hypothetical protein
MANIVGATTVNRATLIIIECILMMVTKINAILLNIVRLSVVMPSDI